MKIPIIILLSLLHLNCKSQHLKTETRVAENEKEIQEQASILKKGDTILAKHGKLDLKALREEYRKENPSISENGTTEILDYFQFESTLSNGTYVAISGDEQDGFSKTIREANSDYETYYMYHPSGILRIIDQAYINEFSLGICFWYSETGEVTKYEDYDAPYTFSWEDVQLFLKENEVHRDDIHQIGRSEHEEVPKWYISFRTKELKGTDNVEHYILNGVTGEVLTKELMDISRELD